ncbi:hypothetical protein TruAng_004780 [Truncatella angustata]|nr:hypothetical protein TruAng_004780 [Truncatella angustata]
MIEQTKDAVRSEISRLYPDLDTIKIDAQPFRLKKGAIWTGPGMLNILSTIQSRSQPTPSVVWHAGSEAQDEVLHPIEWNSNTISLMHDNITIIVLEGEIDFIWITINRKRRGMPTALSYLIYDHVEMGKHMVPPGPQDREVGPAVLVEIHDAQQAAAVQPDEPVLEVLAPAEGADQPPELVLHLAGAGAAVHVAQDVGRELEVVDPAVLQRRLAAEDYADEVLGDLIGLRTAAPGGGRAAAGSLGSASDGRSRELGRTIPCLRRARLLARKTWHAKVTVLGCYVTPAQFSSPERKRDRAGGVAASPHGRKVKLRPERPGSRRACPVPAVTPDLSGVQSLDLHPISCATPICGRCARAPGDAVRCYDSLEVEIGTEAVGQMQPAILLELRCETLTCGVLEFDHRSYPMSHIV